MKLKISLSRQKKWLAIALIIATTGGYPVYAYVTGITSDDNETVYVERQQKDVPSNDDKSREQKQTKNVKKAEPPVEESQQQLSTDAESIIPVKESENINKTTIVKDKTSPQPQPKIKDAPEEYYANGSSAWWVNERWTQHGYVTGNWGNTCSSWRTGAQASGIGVVGGPDLHRIICRDVSGYSLFGFIEQVRTDGYVVSAYDWAGEPGPKQLVMKSFDGFVFIAPKSKQ